MSVLLVPVAARATFFPLTRLSLASLRVMVTVIVAVLSATAEVGAAAIVDTLADTAPDVKVTVTVLVRLRLSVISVAEIVFASVFVDLMVAVA